MATPYHARNIVTAIPGPNSVELAEQHRRYVSAGVGQGKPVFACSASGATITDVDGNTFIDLASGIAVASVGNSAPEVVNAIQEEAAKLTHTNFATTPYAEYIEVCRLLSKHVPIDGPTKSVLVNSGAESVENAVKIARKYTGRSAIVVMENAFHGRTNLTMAMTMKSMPYKRGFGSFAPDVYRVPFSYPLRDEFGMDGVAAARHAIDSIEVQVGSDQVAAIIAEPIQGEGGFIVPAPGFLKTLSDWAHEHGIVYISDEVQAGFCRTGDWFACEHDGVRPDLVSMAKAMGGGMPIAAVTGRAEIMDAVQPGGIGGTYGGNPVACAAAVAAIRLMENHQLDKRALELECIARNTLSPLVEDVPAVAEIRGRGAMIGIEFVKGDSMEPNGDLVQRIAARTVQEGLIILTCGIHGNVIRLLPPLVISDAEYVEALSALKEIILEESNN